MAVGKDPYTSGALSSPPYVSKSVVSGRICAILDLRLDDRGLQLIPQPSRAVAAGAVHELLITDEENIVPGSQVDRVSGIGFFVVDQPGVLLANDRVLIGAATVATVAGFDETHLPNHYNIVLYAQDRRTGVELELSLEDEVSFVFPTHSED